ncbi:MAG: CoA transferase [Acidimicrobiia bacterium]
MTEHIEISPDDRAFLPQLFPHAPAPRVEITGHDTLPSAFDVTGLATATIAAAGTAAARLIALLGSGPAPSVVVDRHLANLWFGFSLRPIGWTMPSPWDPIAGDYRGEDGWIRLHTNAPHHRHAALTVLGCRETRDEVTTAVERWSTEDLESAVVAAGGCAAAMRTATQWTDHLQGRAIAGTPVVDVEMNDGGGGTRRRPSTPGPSASFSSTRPLGGVRVLDLTRVLSGPVATRFLAGLGADVLRIDPPQWDEPGVIPEVTVGKRCARLDLRTEHDAATLARLMANADIMIHGYRPGALDGLGFSAERRREINPGLVDVSLSAYGLIGPWACRRGFDSLVQMSTGIAHAGMVMADTAQPKPLPVQALDHATGYLLAAAALHGWCERIEHDRASTWTASLARTAALLSSGGSGSMDAIATARTDDDESDRNEDTSWGPGRRLRSPVQIGEVELQWESGASALGSETDAAWLADDPA